MTTRVLVGIPTRDRPEYLSMVLSGLVMQTHRDFEVLIVNTNGGDETAFHTAPVDRFISTLRMFGNSVDVVSVPVSGHSEATAVNYILVEARRREVDFVFKVDDDHLLPADTLGRLMEGILRAERKDASPVLLSGVTPWMDHAEYAPEEVRNQKEPLKKATAPLTDIWLENSKVCIRAGHFFRYSEAAVVQTNLASAANFMMRPDARVLWSDTGNSSLFADALWFIQLQVLLHYRLFIDTSVEVWHVAAPHGGVKEKGNLEKNSRWDDVRRTALEVALKDFILDWDKVKP